MRTPNRMDRAARLASLALAVMPTACGGDKTGSLSGGSETGSLSVLVEAEDVIQDGLMPGDGVENVRDGWSVAFDKYVVAVGDIELELATDHAITAESPGVHAVDLTAIPAAGLSLWGITGLEPGRWEFRYSALGASDGALRHANVSEADFDEMVENDYTYWIEGALAKADGRSCPPSSFAAPPSGATLAGENAGGDSCYDNAEISFVFGVAAETVFGPCEVDGVSGVSIPAGGTQTAAITFHGDHLFFNGFPEGDEGGTMRLAQWLADCDLNLDGEVTREELEQLRPSDLPEMDERFQLGGSPISGLETANLLVYVAAQLKTQGHLQGEGECAIDGAAHEH